MHAVECTPRNINEDFYTNLGPGLAPTNGKGRTLGAGITGPASSEPWLVVDVVGVDGCSKDIIELISIAYLVFSKIFKSHKKVRND